LCIKNEEIACQIIRDKSDLNNARSLLYESYVTHLAWEITNENPSNIKITRDKNRMMLTDDYDNLSIWFSINIQKEVVACARLCKEDKQGLLEIERYENASRALDTILSQKKHLKIIELNREAILPSHSNKKEYGLLLLKSVFEYCLSQNYTLLTTCNIPDWLSIYNLISFNCLDKYSFRYFDSEALPVRVYLATPEVLIELINRIDSKLEKSGNVSLKPLQVA
jgi:hypothetical protein